MLKAFLPYGYVLEIDGSFGEGGGQILRTALALSALTGVPVRIYNIRKRRPRPGLQPQHLAVVRALETITEAKVKGAYLDSLELYFEPRTIKGGFYSVNIGTAGSVTLLAQAVLPVLLFAKEPTKLKIVGGTDVAMAPPADYFSNVFLRALSELGIRVRLTVQRRGYYPKGGGVVLLDVHPVEHSIKPMYLTEQQPFVVFGISHSGALPPDVASRQAEGAKKTLEEHGFEVGEIELDVRSRSEVLCPGSGIVLWSDSILIGSSALGRKGVRAEIVGKTAANLFVREVETGAPIDSHLGDQIVLYLALADGKSKIRVAQLTNHLLTNIWVLEQFLDTQISVNKDTRILEVKGINFRRR